jgi:hypothetical protein
VLNEVITYILKNPVPISRDGFLNAPEFDEKIRFNGLSQPVGHLLHSAARQVEAIDDYFSKNSRFAKNAVRNKLNGLYLQCKQRLRRKCKQTDYADLVFFELLEEIVPHEAKNSPDYPNAQTAALVVISFYFESCDVFEAPDATA